MTDTPRDWMDHAACRDQDPNLFFPDRGNRAAATAAQAKAICATCPVTTHCAALIAQFPTETYGIWAGTSPKQRRPTYTPPTKKPPRPCTYPGCDRPRHSKGLCNAHTLQLRRGVPLTPISSTRHPKPPGDTP